MALKNLHTKVLGALLLLALVPLTLLLLNSHHSLRLVEDLLRQRTTETLDIQTTKALEKRTQMVAEQVTSFLHQVEDSLLDLALLPADPFVYQRFSANHQKQIWYRSGTNNRPFEVRETVPLFSELAFVDATGREQVRIIDGHISNELRQVSDPARTTYLTEDYFHRAADLARGDIWVTHLQGWHIPRDAQLQGAATPLEAVEGAKYRGVVRFATPLRDNADRLLGIVVASLDHRHLMAFTQHISPIDDEDVVFPSYESGNYAFMFDNEGWMITHPKFWNLRGYDETGTLVSPYTELTPPEVIDAGRIPFNLMTSGFIHANYPIVAAQVLAGNSGVLSTVNVGGSNKVMAYAPIPYNRGVYATDGVFGGVTIGAEIDLFHQPAIATARLIQNEINSYLLQSWLMISLTIMFVVFVAYLLSSSIVRPIRMLTEGTRKMARGHPVRVEVDAHDEVGELADSFNTMVEELNGRRLRLLQTLQALRRSRKDIISERNFKNTVFENIETGLLTFNPERRITSANGPACRILQVQRPDKEAPVDWRQMLSSWPELCEVLGRWFADGQRGENDSCRLYVPLQRNGRQLTYRLALFPLSFRQQEGWLLTIEDLTERVNMRQQMARMDRLASLGRMSAGIAHEVRNPLTGVSLLLDELHDRLLGQEVDQQLIRKALQEMERLETLVTEMLNFASIQPPQLRVGRVEEVLKDVLFLIRKQCQLQQVTLSERIAPTLPAIQLDTARIKQVLLNLFNNALDAMPDGGEMTVSLDSDAEYIHLTIADNGTGIAADQLDLVFEPFYTSKGQGTGLGLSISHTIVTEHGGDIRLDSVLNEGTRVHVRLPVVSEQVTE